MNLVCPECGSDSFKTYDYDKIVKETTELRSRFKKVMAQHGVDRAEWIVNEIKLTESMRFLQQKTRKQTAALRRLEERIKKLGRQPYKEEKTAGDLEPGDLLLGDTVVVTQIEYFGAGMVKITGQVPPKDTP